MKKQKGFTLVELIVVIVILGLLAVVALPRFLNVTERAKNAQLEGVAGGLASAVIIARANWEADNRSANHTLLDGKQIWMDTETGHPVGTYDKNGDGSDFQTTNTAGGVLFSMTPQQCVDVFDGLISSAPAIGLVSGAAAQTINNDYTVADIKGLKFVVTLTANSAYSDPDNGILTTLSGVDVQSPGFICAYYQVDDLDTTKDGTFQTGNTLSSYNNYFTYDYAHGTVRTYTFDNH